MNLFIYLLNPNYQIQSYLSRYKIKIKIILLLNKFHKYYNISFIFHFIFIYFVFIFHHKLKKKWIQINKILIFTFLLSFY